MGMARGFSVSTSHATVETLGLQVLALYLGLFCGNSGPHTSVASAFTSLSHLTGPIGMS